MRWQPGVCIWKVFPKSTLSGPCLRGGATCLLESKAVLSLVCAVCDKKSTKEILKMLRICRSFLGDLVHLAP